MAKTAESSRGKGGICLKFPTSGALNSLKNMKKNKQYISYLNSRFYVLFFVKVFLY